MQCPRRDYHIHTKYLGCANGTMEVAAIIAECERLGVASLAITDHLNSRERLSDHAPILDDIHALETDVEIFFGAELNFTGEGEGFVFDEEIKAEHGFQFGIGGIHATYLDEYDEKKLVGVQHEHHLRTCRDPMVDVLVHPYWFHKTPFDENGWPWFSSMKVVPESCARELGQASKETGTAIEINTAAIFVNPQYDEAFVAEYADYLAIIAEEGAVFSVGSDAHDIAHLATIEKGWEAVEKLGLPPERIWHPGRKPVAGKAAAAV